MNRKVGLLFSLTGTTAITERGQCAAAKFAIDESNTEQRTQIMPIIRDISSDPEKCVREATKLAKQGVKIFVGCYTSSCRKAILPILEKYNCFLVYPTLYEGRECHSNVFYTGEVPNQQVHTLLDFITRYFGKRIYCVGSDYVYPRETHQQVKTYLKEKNGTMVGEQYVPFGHKQFLAIYKDIVEKKPDAIFSTLVGESIIPFYRTYHRMKLDPAILPICSPITKETEIKAMNPKFAKGHYSAGSYFQSLTNEENKNFVCKFQNFSQTDDVISSVMFNSYLGTKLILEAIDKTGSEEFHTLFYELKGRKIQTACGPVYVEESYHHLTRPSRIGQAQSDGQFEIVWDSHRNIPPKPFIEKVNSSELVEEVTLEAWGEVSEEALIALSNENKVVYMTEKAKQLTHLNEKERITPKLFHKLEHDFVIHRYDTNRQKLILLKPQPKIYPSKTPFHFRNILTINENYQVELDVAQLAAESTANVLIFGETGTGKELVANAIHHKSDRSNQPFVAVNSGAIPRELISSELFGYVDGAFSGAKKGGNIGKFEAAHKGTLFLDEIGEMPYDLQVVLLRAIENGKISRLGDHQERPIDVRIISATNRNLQEEIAYNSFRSDLYYRLNVLSLTIPPLRERPEDIEILMYHFLKQFQKNHGISPIKVNPEILQALIQHPWPGNIRELRNVLERASLLAAKHGTEIQIDYLPHEYKGYKKRAYKTKHSLEKVECEAIEHVLRESNTISEASKTLGISRSTLYRKMKRFKLA
jgi:transcriptional regulator with PAS, ATPase and Fis domain/ABC-type branched-subunit amino acid transport system substrate-binding protein